ncbi:MAG: Kae1-associated serine/threonine protein kinase [Candidatus Nanohaloarchaeota archaeon QJJ-9]|nr:Kae1-associated serine/threonine protein kinase [Candidatus Nanohaloarchaeota archaeon QJJ-9]
MSKKFQGAEAVVEVSGEKVTKKRVSKGYRHKKLDKELRSERTDMEKKLIHEARRHGVKTPETEKKDDYALEMERIEGEKLKEKVEDNLDLMKKLGENVAYLHSTNIIHGDLTTSNAIVSEELYLIDFGLAFRSDRLEDKAVDIHLLRQVLDSTHNEVAGKAWEKFIEGYKVYEKSERVLEQLEEVESRGRYK